MSQISSDDVDGYDISSLSNAAPIVEVEDATMPLCSGALGKKDYFAFGVATVSELVDVNADGILDVNVDVKVGQLNKVRRGVFETKSRYVGGYGKGLVRGAPLVLVRNGKPTCVAGIQVDWHVYSKGTSAIEETANLVFKVVPGVSIE